MTVKLIFEADDVDGLRADTRSALLALYPGSTITIDGPHGKLVVTNKNGSAIEPPAAAAAPAAKPGKAAPTPAEAAAKVAGATATVVPAKPAATKPAPAATPAVDPLADDEAEEPAAEEPVTVDDVRALLVELKNKSTDADVLTKLLTPFGVKKINAAAADQLVLIKAEAVKQLAALG